jgi:chromosome segregation ATPase
MTAKNLKRQVEFSPLPVQPAALTLDERTQFHARIIALEEDGKQARARGLELYDSNKKLSEEIRRLRAQTPVLEGTISELRQELELAKRERFEAVADRAEAVAELQRLQDLTPSEEVEALRARVAHLEKVLQATEAHLAGEQKTTAMLGEQVDTLEAERNNLRAELAAARGQQ